MISLPTHLKKIIIEQLGRLLGYPTCCTDAYVKIDKPEHGIELQVKYWKESGHFYPCDQHAADLNSGICLIESLIDHDTRRFHRLPAFSAKASAKDLDRKLKSILKKQEAKKWELL